MASARGAWRGPASEAAIALLSAAAMTASCAPIDVDPLDRLGQISGLAAIELRFTLACLALIAALVVAERRRRRDDSEARFARTERWACAALAGLATGLIAGGLLVALRGTPWGFNGRGGDVGRLAIWAHNLHRGVPEAIPPSYPPLPVHILHLYSDLIHRAPGFALKHLEIAGVAAAGPIAYLSWRLMLRPVWALGIGVIASLPLIEPYKPYPNLVLVVFVPVVLRFLTAIRRSASWSELRVARAGTIYGGVFGAMCLMYSGWFQWAAPGLVVAALVVLPWRAPRRSAYLVMLTAAVFLLITKQYALALLDDPTGIKDRYIYFDVQTEPAYIAMWRNDTPGIVGTWPPIGELGGVGLFTLVLVIGLGAATAIGRHKTLVLGLGAMIAGAWLMRFRIARMMWATKLVQLYPRTTPLILYCLLVLVGYAIYARAPRLTRAQRASALLGTVAGLALLFGSVGSALTDRFMPLDAWPPSAGWLTWNAHQTRRGAKPLAARSLAWHRRDDARAPHAAGQAP